MQIRRANIRDLNTLCTLDNIANMTNWSLNDYQNSFNNKQHFIYICEEHGKISACIVFGVALDEAEILQFWVEHSLKRKGIGIYLLNYTLHELRKKLMVIRVFLEVRDGNVAAINLYKKAGFIEVGRRHRYYVVDTWRFDALVMQKEFSGFI